MSFLGRWLSLAIASAVFFVVSIAHAELFVSASPILGPNTPGYDGWVECGVRIENDGVKLEQGSVELTSSSGYPANNQIKARTSFAVTPKASVNVRLPVRTFAFSGGSLDLSVKLDDGVEVYKTTINLSGTFGPFLLDTTEPPRLAGALHDVPMAIRFDPTSGLHPRSHTTGTVPLSTGSLRVDSSTGDPVMPERAAGYAASSLVLMRSDQLARMQGQYLEALANSVLAGNSLALVISRPEDLRSGVLVSMLGGEVKEGAASRTLRRTPGQEIESPKEESRRRMTGRRVFPSEEVEKTLRGFSGGNLRPSIFGSSASYGLGEVHLLPFDPTQSPGLDDAWVKSRMMALVSHAWERRSAIASPHGGIFSSDGSTYSVFRFLDPNESSRWAVIVAALLLLVYAVLAGPVNFSLAASRHRPLRALWLLPILSFGTVLAVMFLGTSARGWTGKARHLTLIEAAPGMTQGTALRYRSFFTSNSRQLTIPASDPNSVLDTATVPRAGAARSLLVDRDGVSLVGLSTMPWEPLLVREDGFASLGAGLSVLRDADGDITVTNRLARDLRAVLIIEPSPPLISERSTYFFPRIRDGQSIQASKGEKVTFHPWSSGPPRLTESDFSSIRSLVERESTGIVKAWGAMGDTCGNEVDWWPEDVPIVMGQVDGGEGRLTDSGLRLESDRVLLRIVGYGGVP